MNNHVSDTLIVTFDNALEDEAGICILRKNGDDIKILKMELGKQADTLYYLLTNQSSKAEIKEY